MKDLTFLLITLGLITFGMMAAQKHYYGEEEKKNVEYKTQRYGISPTASPSATPTPPSP